MTLKCGKPFDCNKKLYSNKLWNLRGGVFARRAKNSRMTKSVEKILKTASFVKES